VFHNSESYYNETITLPLNYLINNSELEFIVSKVGDFLNN